MRKYSAAFLVLASVTLSYAQDVTPESPLPERFGYNMKKFRGTLSYIESELKNERWKRSKEAATDLIADIDKRVSWTKGKIHPENVQIVALKAQAKALEARAIAGLASKNAPAAAKTSSDTSAASSASGGELDKSFRYHFDKMPGQLKYAQQYQAKGSFKNALNMVNNVLADLEKRVKWSRGKVSPDHPQVVALRKKAEAIKASIEGDSSAANDASKELKPVIQAIQELAPRIQKAVSEGCFGLSGLVNLEDSYARNRSKEMIFEKRAEGFKKIRFANSQSSLAKQTAEAFRSQFPNQAKLEALLPDLAYEAFSSVQILEGQVERWNTERNRGVKSLLDKAEEAVSDAETTIQNTDSSNTHLVAYAESTARMYAVDLYGHLMEVPAVVFPEGHSDRSTYVKKAQALNERILEIENNLAKLKGIAADAKAARIAAARFPKEGIEPPGLDKEEILAAVKKEFDDGPILKVGISSPWETRTEARWVHDRWDVGTFQYVGLVLATATPSGKTRVYHTTARRRQQANGDFGKAKHYSVGHSYEVLPENIK